MFGQGLSFEKTCMAPKWAQALVHQYAPGILLVWHPVKTRGDYNYGSYYRRHRAIEIFGSTDERPESVFVVLHEITHHRRGEIKAKRGSRNKHHDKRFFIMAAALYAKHPSILEHAAKREYKTGRKYMQAALDRLNAAKPELQEAA